MIGKSPAGSIGRWGSNITASITTDTSVATWAVEDLSTSGVVFAGAGGRLQTDSGQLVWNATNNRLGVGLTAPLFPVQFRPATDQNFQFAGGISSTGIVIGAVNDANSVNIPIEFRGSKVLSISPLIFAADNANDIGSTGNVTGRPRNIYAGGFIAVGASPTTDGVAGQFRLPNNSFVTTRTAANSSDISFIGCDTSNRLNLQANTQSLVILNASTQATVSSTGVAAALPVLPVGYWQVTIGGTARVIPYYNASS